MHLSGWVRALDLSLQNVIGEGSVFVVNDHYDVAVAQECVKDVDPVSEQ